MRDLMWLAVAGVVTVFLAWGGLSASPEWSPLAVTEVPDATAGHGVVAMTADTDADEPHVLMALAE